jgi:hypothetical protein
MCIKRYEFIDYFWPYGSFVILPLQVFNAEIDKICICELKNKNAKDVALKGVLIKDIKNNGDNEHDWFFPYKTKLKLDSAYPFFYNHFILIDK